MSIYLNPKGYRYSDTPVGYFQLYCLDQPQKLLLANETHLSIEETYILQACKKYADAMWPMPIVIREYYKEPTIKHIDGTLTKVGGFFHNESLYVCIFLSKNREPAVFLHEFGHVLHWLSLLRLGKDKAETIWRETSLIRMELIASIYGLSISKRLNLPLLVEEFERDIAWFDDGALQDEVLVKEEANVRHR